MEEGLHGPPRLVRGAIRPQAGATHAAIFLCRMSQPQPTYDLMLLLDVESTLAIFEPRLENVRISMVEQEGESRRRELRFVVEATLRLDPTPEQVVFDTVLHYSSGQVDVQGRMIGGDSSNA